MYTTNRRFSLLIICLLKNTIEDRNWSINFLKTSMTDMQGCGMEGYSFIYKTQLAYLR